MPLPPRPVIRYSKDEERLPKPRSESVSTNSSAADSSTTRNPDGGAGGSGASNQDEFNRRQFNVKLDHNFNDRHSISARYFGGTGTQTAEHPSALRLASAA